MTDPHSHLGLANPRIRTHRIADIHVLYIYTQYMHTRIHT